MVNVLSTIWKWEVDSLRWQVCAAMTSLPPGLASLDPKELEEGELPTLDGHSAGYAAQGPPDMWMTPRQPCPAPRSTTVHMDIMHHHLQPQPLLLRGHTGGGHLLLANPGCAQFVSNSPKTENGSYLGLRGSNPNSEGMYSTRNAPLFVVSKPKNRPTRRLDPRRIAHLVEPEGSVARAQWGANGGSSKVSGAKKNRFFKSCS